MKQRLILKIVVLSFILLFFAEYFEPSTIGVRAGYLPLRGGASTLDDQSPSPGENAPSIPHAMMVTFCPAPKKLLPESMCLPIKKLFFKQQLQNEIYHPPVLTS